MATIIKSTRTYPYKYCRCTPNENRSEWRVYEKKLGGIVSGFLIRRHAQDISTHFDRFGIGL